ncbi:hypothetical protein SAOR_01025 [Salinisphaera orenii MK-B5]|uniref:Integrase n=1 Tax=Salinisphaera orenii MK-B5 TaxID=856730 RepID=A0A423PYC9_9GAMM|nr:site-specific integrase [Salinisphaera orenii]ROO30605.1 hypothetical protein SAOR_01025 [Salinisphaera orenii MK-B5]
MPSQKLTEAVLKNMPKPAKRTDIRDAQTTGLYLRVHPSGRKSWRMRYQFHDKPRVLSLGEWPAMKLSAARKAVLDHHETLAEGSDPAGDVQKAKAVRDRMPTVEEFAEEYIERHAKVNKKSWATDKRILDREVTPYIGKIGLDAVHRRDIVGVLDRIRDRGADTMANRTYAVVRKMFGFAVERGVLDLSPAQHIKLTAERSRDVVLTDDAIRHLWAVTAPYGESDKALPMHHATRLALRLMLLTGQRSGEVCGLALAELDHDKSVWMIPGRRTKNGLDQTVPLSDMALDVIAEAMDTASDEHLFAASSEAGHLTSYAPVQAMERIFDGWEPRYTPHDLRRTVGTRLGELGFNRLIVDKVLNHKDRSIGGVYDRHSYDLEKRAALDTWASALQAVIDGERENKVVPMAR